MQIFMFCGASVIELQEFNRRCGRTWENCETPYKYYTYVIYQNLLIFLNIVGF